MQDSKIEQVIMMGSIFYNIHKINGVPNFCLRAIDFGGVIFL